MCDSTPFSSPSAPALTPQQLKRRVMYKTSPNWQQLYREQCITTLRDKRQETRSRLVDKFRNIDINETVDVVQFDVREQLITEVMKTVWNKYTGSEFPANDAMDQSDISDFMEQVRQELISEEDQYWEELLERRKEEELDWLLENRDSVVCFFCERNPLKLTRSDTYTQIECENCGFRLYTQLSVNLCLLQERIDDMISAHNSICFNRNLCFDKINTGLFDMQDIDSSNNNNISLSCAVCGESKLVF